MIEELLKKHLSDFKADKILDIGPGYSNFGRVSAQLTGANSITYVDNNSNVLQWQATECGKKAIKCELLLLSAEDDDLQRLKGPYDLILCQEILEHLVDPGRLVIILARLLSPKGRIVITVPTKKSERWLKLINRSYMEGGLFGHIQEFDESELHRILHKANLYPLVFIPTQPHYFVAHTWLFGSRMVVEDSTGAILSHDERNHIFSMLLSGSRRFFNKTGSKEWGYLLPRNYFVIAKRSK